MTLNVFHYNLRFSILYLGIWQYSSQNIGQYVFSTFVACVTSGCHSNQFLCKQTRNHGITALVKDWLPCHLPPVQVLVNQTTHHMVRKLTCIEILYTLYLV